MLVKGPKELTVGMRDMDGRQVPRTGQRPAHLTPPLAAPQHTDPVRRWPAVTVPYAVCGFTLAPHVHGHSTCARAQPVPHRPGICIAAS